MRGQSYHEDSSDSDCGISYLQIPQSIVTKRDACDVWTQSPGCFDLGACVLAFAELP
jgi:hypothetical protein